MEFPFGHSHSHTHHHQRNDDDDEGERIRDNYPPPPLFDQPPPPPPPTSQFYHQPPPDFPPPPPPNPYLYQEPANTHVYHTSHHHQEPPHYSPPPPPSQVTHVSHDSPQLPETHHSHIPSFFHKPSHDSPHYFSNKPTFMVYSKADPNFHLAIRGGKVLLVPSDPSDDFQHWYKDQKYSTRVKDEEGFPCFALVNKATGEAMKHSVGATHPVQLTPYNPDVLDSSVLWTEGKDLGDGYRTVRMVNNIRLNVDAFHGDKHSGGVHDGTTIVLWQWNKGDNQRWKIVPQ